jgi:hypothetical protein
MTFGESDIQFGMYHAMIVSVQGTNPGAASGISYTVDVNFPAGKLQLVGVKPAWSRPPDAIDTRAAAVGTACLVSIVGDLVQAFIPEFPDTQSC